MQGHVKREVYLVGLELGTSKHISSGKEKIASMAEVGGPTFVPRVESGYGRCLEMSYQIT